VTDTAVAFLGAIAIATVTMALLQVGAVVYGALLARRAAALVAKVEGDLAPVIERLTAMSAEASRAASLAATQVEKVDRLVTDVTRKADRAMDAAQHAILLPAREGIALAAGVKATLGTLRRMRRDRAAARLRGEDDDALFIG
jgi:hypothetical protein